MWKELPEEEKEPYREEERDDKARHEEDMKEFEGGRIFEKTDYKRKKKQ